MKMTWMNCNDMIGRSWKPLGDGMDEGDCLLFSCYALYDTL